MKPEVKTKNKLIAENEDLRLRLAEAEETLQAIYRGEVDALVVSTVAGDQVFTLTGAESAYRLLIEGMNEGAITLSVDGVILYCNTCFARMVSTPLEKVIGGALSRFVASSDLDMFGAIMQQGLQGSGKGELTFRTADGTILPVYLSASVLKMDGEQRVSCVIATDLTWQKRSEEIVAAEKLARSILEHAAEAIVVCDERGRVIRANQAAQTLCGDNPLGKLFDDLYPLRLSDGEPFSLSGRMSGESLIGIGVQLDQKFHLLLSTGDLVDAQHKRIGMVITLTDITALRRVEQQTQELLAQTERSRLQLLRSLEDQKRTEQQMKAALADKEILLHEVHHRVGNNLAVMSALLEMQANASQEEQVRVALKTGESRIHAMALVHEQLYSSHSLEEIDMSKYLPSLARGLFLSGLINQMDIQVDARDVILNIERAIPCGLIINELVMNAIQHAFPERTLDATSLPPHRITVAMRLEAGQFVMIVSDNGCGLPDGMDVKQAKTLGLKLVNRLVGQLHGELQVESAPGAGCSFRITFPTHVI